MTKNRWRSMYKGGQYDPYCRDGAKKPSKKFYEETPDEKDEDAATWLVLYDFKGARAGRAT